MVFSYAASVLLLSFAIFGICCFFKEVWTWAVQPYLFRKPKISFVIFVKDIEQEVEEMLRHLMFEIENSGLESEVVVMDCGSADLTGSIIQRLGKEFGALLPLHAKDAPNGIGDVLPHCAGGIIHVLDTIHRIKPEHFIPVVCWLLKEKAGD